MASLSRRRLLGQATLVAAGGPALAQTGRPTRILVTGDGGCACETGSRSQSGTGARGGLLLGLAALLGLVVLRRRRRP